MRTSVFTNMFSLLNPPTQEAPWPISLDLPQLQLAVPSFNFYVPIPVPIKTESQTFKTSRVSACPHTDKKHYAKKMCINCYHKFGRTKLAWKCSHKQRLHYAKGKCHLCYLHQLSHKKAVQATKVKKC
mmetsp:Transcript_19567/g.35886  ORF Transcript_19567/g.35886 Transcript_19567/m.35886 type:complete len:128 (-) Transcript_19567:1372-1755(-)